MDVKKSLLVLTAVLSLGSTGFLKGQSMSADESLKVTHETLANAVKQGNLTLIQGLIHPRALGFFWDSQMLVELRPDFGPAQALPPVIADLSRFIATPYSATYRVIDDTGVVCMTTSRVPKKGEKQPVGYYRLTYVYVQSEGNWKLLSWHSSETPLKRQS